MRQQWPASRLSTTLAEGAGYRQEVEACEVYLTRAVDHRDSTPVRESADDRPVVLKQRAGGSGLGAGGLRVRADLRDEGDFFGALTGTAQHVRRSRRTSAKIPRAGNELRAVARHQRVQRGRFRTTIFCEPPG
jgi:hypothetical protein